MSGSSKDVGCHAAASRCLLDELARAFDAHAAGSIPERVFLHDKNLPEGLRGEGEVSACFRGTESEISAQECSLIGVWLLRSLHGDGHTEDWLEIGRVPALFRALSKDVLAPLPGAWRQDVSPDLVAAPALLEELEYRWRERRADSPAYVLNLTQLPVSAQDLAFLDRHLGGGSFRAHSRGHADCFVSDTRWPDCWRVTYRDAAARVILDTVELTAMPEVLMAGEDDIRDSRRELAWIIERFYGRQA